MLKNAGTYMLKNASSIERETDAKRWTELLIFHYGRNLHAMHHANSPKDPNG